MAIAVPQVGQQISASSFGKPVADWVNVNDPTPWVNLPLGPSISLDQSMTPPRYRKIGDLVYLIGSAITSNGPSTTALLGVLPVGFRPTRPFRFANVAMDVSGAPFPYRMDLGTDGSINVYIGNWNTIIISIVIPTT